jgi:hypothetical protein
MEIWLERKVLVRNYKVTVETEWQVDHHMMHLRRITVTDGGQHGLHGKGGSG